MIVKTLSLILVLSALGGCTLIPEYIRPSAPVPAEWPAGSAYKANPEPQPGWSVPNVGWHAFYTDEKMQRVVSLALENNRDLRVAVLNVEKTQAQYRIQRAALVPQVDAIANGTEQRWPTDVSQTGSPYTYRQYFVGLGVSSYELDLFGRVRSLKEQALQQYFASDEARRAVQISLIAEVANAYLNYAADCERLKVSRDTLTSQEKSYELTRSKFLVGVSSELDVRQAETRVEAAKADIALYMSNVAQDQNVLTLLVGGPVPKELLRSELGNGAMFADITAGISSEVLLSRPDILQAERQLKAANANIGAARAAFFPAIQLTANAGTMSAQMGSLFRYGQDSWTWAPTITLPIFDAGARWASLDVAKADKNIFVAQYEKAIQTAFREVADALAVRGTVGERLRAQEARVDASEIVYRLSEARYVKGIDNYLGVLDAERSLYDARQQLISVRLQRLANTVTLYKTLGGGSLE